MKRCGIVVLLVLSMGACFAETGAPSTEGGPVESAVVASPPSTLRVIATYPLDGEPLDSQIVFFFSENIVVDQSKSAPPFRIRPELPFSEWRIGPNFVALRVEPTLNSTYEVALGDGVRSVTGALVRPDDRVHTFHCFQFAPVNPTWHDNEDGTTTLLIEFPVAMDPSAISDYIKAFDSSGEIEFSVKGGGANNVVTLQFAKDDNSNNFVELSPGLPDALGVVRTQKAYSYAAPGPPSLRVYGCRIRRFSASEQELEIRFSAPVTGRQVKDHLSIVSRDTKESLPFKIDERLESSVQYVTLWHTTSQSLDIDVGLTVGLSGRGNTILRQPFSARLHGTVPQLAFRHYYWERGGRDGLVLKVSLSAGLNASEFEKHFSVEPSIGNMRVEGSGSGTFGISGDWVPNTNYVLRLSPGAVSLDGDVLNAERSIKVKSESIPTYLGFDFQEKMYFPRRHGRALTVESRNLSEMKLTLSRLFPNNIAVAVPDVNNKYVVSDSWGETLRSVSIPIDQKTYEITRTAIPIAEELGKDKRGVFHLAATGEDGARAEQLIVLTDIGVACHWIGNDELVVFAHDLQSLVPLPDAKVTVYSRKNQVLSRGVTDTSGIFQSGKSKEELGTPRVVVIEKGDDYTFLELEPTSEENPALRGLPGFDKEEYEAFLYADRELYRPGDTVHLRWTVRQNYGDAVPTAPVRMTVYKPNKKELVSKTLALSSVGTGSYDIATEKSYATGKYRVELKVPGSDRIIGSYTISLEEFVPNRLKASLSMADTQLVCGKTSEIHFNAQHLFGAPASGRRCEVEVRLFPMSEDAPRPNGGEWAKLPDGFHFGNDDETLPVTVYCGETETDANGDATFTFDYAGNKVHTAPMRAVIVGRVFELGGRPVTTVLERTYFPAPISLGLSLTKERGQKELLVKVAALNADATPSDVKTVTVLLERESWSYYVRRFHSHYGSRWTPVYEPVMQYDVPVVNGFGEIRFPMEGYGRYRVRVTASETLQFSAVTFYSYGRYFRLGAAEEPELVKITLDKDVYDVGDVAHVRVKAPFDGRCFGVIHGESIYASGQLPVTDGECTFDLPITEAYFPNVWIEGTVVHEMPDDRAGVYPFASFAMKNVLVRDLRREISITFEGLPEEVRPATKQTVTLAVVDGAGQVPAQAEVTLAAVDEGIHGITGYKNPDPVAWLRRARRPSGYRSDYYDKVAYDFAKPPIGGDAAALLAKRLAEDDNTWIKTVALWSGVVTPDATGRVTVPLDIPEFTGTLRLVAVACSDKALGAEARELLVRRKYMMRTHMPRFMLPGDSAMCQATLFNHSDAPCTVEVACATSGTLVDTTKAETYTLGPKSEATLKLLVRAEGLSGQGHLLWTARFADMNGGELESLREEDPLPVRQPAAFQSHHELLILKPGEMRTITNTQFLDDARAELSVTVAASPLLRLRNALGDVVHYPYGCVEQTTSKLMPMYLLRNTILAAPALESLDKARLADDYLIAGIDRLFTMQTAGGGLSVWPGGDRPYPYGSIYALHFLTLVKQDRQISVPEKPFKALQQYVRTLAFEAVPQDGEYRPYYSHYRHGRLYQRAYALFVLCLDGDLEALKQIERLDNVALPTAGRYLLAAALARNTQDPERVRAYLDNAPCEAFTQREQGGTLSSSIRNTGVRLLALMHIQDRESERAALAQELIDWLDAGRRGSTQEYAFVVTALAEFFQNLGENQTGASASIEDASGSVAIEGSELFEKTHTGPNGRFTVTNTGSMVVYVDVTSRGIPKEVDWRVVKQGIGVERGIETYAGDVHSGDHFAQGDAFVVTLQITCDQRIENVVVADLLPAGFEVENPRLDESVTQGLTLTEAVTPSFLDIRDDRIITAYDRLERGVHYFHYVVRAVTPGTFTMPPVTAECMYDARLRGASVPHVITIGDAERNDGQ